MNIKADEMNGIELSVLKVWDDFSDYEGLRPESIEVTLYQNNERTNVTAILSESNHWFYKLDVLVAEEDNNGDRIHYTWRCDEIDGYQRYTDDLDHMYIITDVHHYNDKANDDSVLLRKLDTNNEFLDHCNMQLKDDEGNILITWVTDDENSVNIYDSRLDAAMDDNGSLVVNNLPAGEYVYEEILPKAGYTSAGSKAFKVEKESESYTYNWYTSLESAIEDANSLTTEYADCYRDDEDCEAGLFIIDDIAYMILLKDTTVSDNMHLSSNTIADFDNHILTLNKDKQIQFDEDLALYNGTIETNSISVINADISSTNYSSGFLNIENFHINNEYEDDENSSAKIKTISGSYLSKVRINHSEINSQSTINIGVDSGCFNYCVYLNNSQCDITIKDSDLICNNVSSNKNCLIETTALYFMAETANINNVVIQSMNQSSNRVYGVRYRGGYNKPVINFSDCNITANSTLTASNSTRFYNVTGIHSSTHNELNLYNNHIQTYSNFKTTGLQLNSKSSSGVNQCNMSGNTVISRLKTGLIDGEANAVYANGCRLHIMSGYIWASPSRWSGSDSTGSSSDPHYDSRGNGVICNASSVVVIDESKGETVIVGGNAAIGVHAKTYVTINAGTFKSPNHGGAYVACGPSGYCEINGGSFLCNVNEYTNEELNGVHGFGALYFGHTDSNTGVWTVNVRNAIVKGGTYGIRVKSNNGYRGATIYLYDCYVQGNGNDIFLDKTTTSENAYCYIESGTVLYHDGTEQPWVDGYANAGLPPHIIDNR